MTRSYAKLPLLLLAFQAVPAQAYTCYRDAFGRRRCSGLARGARIGIGVAIAVGFLLLLMLLLLFRRRRMQRRNMAFIQQPAMTAAPQPGYQPQTGYPTQPNNGAYAASPYGGPAQHGAPQFPAAAHHTGAPAYDGGYAPPAGPPPGAGGYAPPPGPPPIKS